MVKRIVLAIFMTIGGFNGIALAQEAHVAIIKNISGSVKILRKERALSAIPGMQLMRRDKVISGEKANAGIIFIDGTLVTIGSSTEIEVSQYLFEPKEARYAFNLHLQKGTAIYSSGKLGKLAPDAVTLKTPRAIVGVHGTRIIIEVN
jgi:hypothetical protein